MDVDTAREELLRGAGTQFDPKIVTIFINLLEDGTIEKIRSEEIQSKQITLFN